MPKLLCTKNPIDKRKLFTIRAQSNVKMLQGYVWDTVASGIRNRGHYGLRFAVRLALDLKRQPMHAIGRKYEPYGFEYDYFYVVKDNAIDRLVLARLTDDLQAFSTPLMSYSEDEIKAKIVDFRDGWEHGWILTELIVVGAGWGDEVISPYAVDTVVKKFGKHKAAQLVDEAKIVLQEADDIWKKKDEANRYSFYLIAAQLVLQRRVFAL